MQIKRKGGRDADWKCIYCGKFVSYEDPDVVTECNMRWDYHREDVYEEYDTYHKKCKPKERNAYEEAGKD